MIVRVKESLYYKYRWRVIMLLIIAAMLFQWWYILAGCYVYISGLTGENS